jgi:mRNA interferase MazF
MTIYKFGDVILVPFPFTNQRRNKQRPAIVISSDIYNRSQPDLIIIAVTSQVYENLHFGEMKIDNWSKAGLIKPSIVKPVITTIEHSLVIKKLGEILPIDRQSLTNNLLRIIGD